MTARVARHDCKGGEAQLQCWVGMMASVGRHDCKNG